MCHCGTILLAGLTEPAGCRKREGKRGLPERSCRIARRPMFLPDPIQLPDAVAQHDGIVELVPLLEQLPQTG